MLKLPIEIVLLIREFLDENDLNYLTRSTRRFFPALQHILYRRNMLKGDGWALIWAIIDRQDQTAKLALGTGVTRLGEALAFAAKMGKRR